MLFLDFKDHSEHETETDEEHLEDDELLDPEQHILDSGHGPKVEADDLLEDVQNLFCLNSSGGLKSVSCRVFYFDDDRKPIQQRPGSPGK